MAHWTEKKISITIRLPLPARAAAIFAAVPPSTRAECVLWGMKALGLLEAGENEEKDPNKDSPTLKGGVR